MVKVAFSFSCQVKLSGVSSAAVRAELYLGVATDAAVEGGVVTSHSKRVHQGLCEQRPLAEVKVIVNWVFVDFTYEGKIKHLQKECWQVAQHPNALNGYRESVLICTALGTNVTAVTALVGEAGGGFAQ